MGFVAIFHSLDAASDDGHAEEMEQMEQMCNGHFVQYVVGFCA
jgi:hypothetical protein